MATNKDIVMPEVFTTTNGRCEKSIGKFSRSYLLVLCFTIIINKGFLFVDALEHRHGGK